jgi:hypothetical protein
VCNGLGLRVRAKQDSSSSIPLMTSTTNTNEIDSDEEGLTDNIQLVSQPTSINNLSNFVASLDQSLLLTNQYFNNNNDDDVIASKTSLNEETTNSVFYLGFIFRVGKTKLRVGGTHLVYLLDTSLCIF